MEQELVNKREFSSEAIKSLNEKAAQERMEMITNLPKFESMNY